LKPDIPEILTINFDKVRETPKVQSGVKRLVL